jgi:hypothetical protein
MTRIDFKHFSNRWAKLFQRNQFVGHNIEQPLHMSDFLGTGKHASLRPELKRALFREAATLINEHKLYSISTAVSQVEFKSELSHEVRSELIGPYGFAFFALVLAHQTLSERQSGGPVKTAYLVDRGFGHQYQLNQAHKLIVDFETALRMGRHTGSLAVAADDHVPPLQAADVIAWASRRMQVQGKLPEGFEPLEEVLREDTERPHKTIRIPLDGIQMLSKPVNNWILKHGRMPTLRDIMVRTVDGHSFQLKS